MGTIYFTLGKTFSSTHSTLVQLDLGGSSFEDACQRMGLTFSDVVGAYMNSYSGTIYTQSGISSKSYSNGVVSMTLTPATTSATIWFLVSFTYTEDKTVYYYFQDYPITNKFSTSSDIIFDESLFQDFAVYSNFTKMFVPKILDPWQEEANISGYKIQVGSSSYPVYYLIPGTTPKMKTTSPVGFYSSSSNTTIYIANGVLHVGNSTFTSSDFYDGVLPRKIIITLQAPGSSGSKGQEGVGGGSGACWCGVVDISLLHNSQLTTLVITPGTGGATCSSAVANSGTNASIVLKRPLQSDLTIVELSGGQAQGYGVAGIGGQVLDVNSSYATTLWQKSGSAGGVTGNNGSSFKGGYMYSSLTPVVAYYLHGARHISSNSGGTGHANSGGGGGAGSAFALGGDAGVGSGGSTEYNGKNGSKGSGGGGGGGPSSFTVTGGAGGDGWFVLEY